MKVFIIEDEPDFRELLQSELENEGYTVFSHGDGIGVMSLFNNNRPNIILLDMNLPQRDGMEILAEIKSHAEYRDIPIIIVTGRDDESEIVKAFNSGADDYLVKPFTLDILRARMKAVLRRSQPVQDSAKKLSSKDLSVDLSTHQVFLNNQEIKLTLTEYNILTYLLRKTGQVVARDEIRTQALNDPTISDRTLDVHMTAVRKKLAHRGPSIITIRGVGFRFDETAN